MLYKYRWSNLTWLGKLSAFNIFIGVLNIISVLFGGSPYLIFVGLGVVLSGICTLDTKHQTF